jgi:hypothetical protein
MRETLRHGLTHFARHILDNRSNERKMTMLQFHAVPRGTLVLIQGAIWLKHLRPLFCSKIAAQNFIYSFNYCLSTLFRKYCRHTLRATNIAAGVACRVAK